MKTTFTIIALSLAAATVTTAYAEDITPDDTATVVFASPKTRAQVQAELFQARADGSAAVWADDYNPLRLAVSERSREAVQAEVLAAQGAPSFYGEDSGSFELAKAATQPVASPVLAGLSSGKR
jgi:hypothetical protein